MVKQIIYFDHAATSKVYPEVLQTYNQITNEYFANPSSIHFLGQQSSRLLQTSRERILETLHLNNHEVIYTSSATEANNLAIKGYCFANKKRGNHLITNKGEHPSVIQAFLNMEQFGFEVTVLPINENGIVDPFLLKNAIKDETILVSTMAVNNETGAINDIETIGRLLKDYPKIAFHVDMVQAIGKIDVCLKNVDMFTIAGHKIHGLPGSASLIKKKNILLKEQINGGGQENHYRSGTNTLALSLSLSKALRISVENQKINLEKVTLLRDRLYSYLKDHQDLYIINSSFLANPYILNFSLFNKKASVVVEALSNEGIMVSSLSACSSKKEKMSEVLYAMHQDIDRAQNSIRISFSFENTIEEVDTLIACLDKIVKEIKQ